MAEEEDLIIGEESEEEEYDVEYYDYDDIQLIVAACDALNTVESINAMTAADQKRVNRIKRKCLRLIEHHISEIYSLTFDKNDDNED